jgi:hypothetical protein
MKKKSKVRKSLYSIVFFLILTSLFVGISMITESNQINDSDLSKSIDTSKDNTKLKLSAIGDPINSQAIIQNTSIVRRVFESVNFTVNITEFLDEGGNKTQIVLIFQQAEHDLPPTKTFNMTQIGTSNNWTYTYRAGYNDTLGRVDVKFKILNASGPDSMLWLQVNSDEVAANFTIISNSMVSFDQDDYNVGNVLFGNLLIDGSSDYRWNISVSDNADITKENILFDIGYKVFFFNFAINQSFNELNKYYYIKVNMTKISTSKNFAEYFYFKVLPPITLFESGSIEFIPSSVFRVQTGWVYANVTHADYGYNIIHINVSLKLEDTNGNEVYNQDTTNNNDGSFTGTFSIAATSPIGKYRYTLTSEYKDEIVETDTGLITVKNNPPKIDGYEINDYDTDESISVLYGEDLEFEFDVSDVEGVAYVTVKLENEEGDDYEITRDYESDLKIVVRTAELITGTWDVYVYVTDTDGLKIGLDSDFDDAPQKITIIPDTLSEVFPWVTLIIGILLGVILSIGISYYMIKSKKVKPISEKKRDVIPKKPVREKIPREVKPVPIQEEPIKKESIKEKPEEKERRKIAPPRKIKRRLK